MRHYLQMEENASAFQCILDDVPGCDSYQSWQNLPHVILTQVACFLSKMDLFEFSLVDRRTCKAALDPFVDVWQSLSLAASNLMAVRTHDVLRAATFLYSLSFCWFACLPLSLSLTLVWLISSE